MKSFLEFLGGLAGVAAVLAIGLFFLLIPAMIGAFIVLPLLGIKVGFWSVFVFLIVWDVVIAGIRGLLS